MVISFNAKAIKQSENRSAFTMIEMVFVIVILGILSAVAIPRLAASRDDAVLVKGKSQVSAIRSGIALQKSRRMLEGTTPFLPLVLDNAAYNTENEKLFYFNDGNSSNILEYALFSGTKDGTWMKTAANVYSFKLNATNVTFNYTATSGSFDCDHNDQNCKDLSE